MSEHRLVLKLRSELMSRGTSAIKNLGMFFRQIDENKSKTLSFEEFKRGINDHNLNLSIEEINDLFNLYDKDESGSVCYEEFIQSVRVRLIKTKIRFVPLKIHIFLTDFLKFSHH
jgi:Ca2+-binding EF-hand superfamily protein